MSLTRTTRWTRPLRRSATIVGGSATYGQTISLHVLVRWATSTGLPSSDWTRTSQAFMAWTGPSRTLPTFSAKFSAKFSEWPDFQQHAETVAGHWNGTP